MVQVVLVAESRRLQAMLATYGIQSQTPKEVEPVQIWSQKQLVQASTERRAETGRKCSAGSTLRQLICAPHSTGWF